MGRTIDELSRETIEELVPDHFEDDDDSLTDEEKHDAMVRFLTHVFGVDGEPLDPEIPF
jgi:hypothetical protein